MASVSEWLGMLDQGEAPNCTTDCRTEVGVTVGLIDSLIAIARVLAQRDLSPAEAREALADLRTDEDMARVLMTSVEREVLPQFLTTQDMDDLRRLEDLFSDGEGWDLPKERMTRLAELGAIRRTTRDRYCMTAFGRWCIGAWTDLPLKTWQEQCDEAQRQYLARSAAQL